MRASGNQVRGAAVGAVEVARNRASEVVGGSADHLVATIERGAKGLEGGIERAVDVLPGIAVEVARPRRRRRPSILVLLVLAAGAGALVVWLRRRAAVPAGEGAGYHVVPADGGGWNLTGADVDDVISHHDTQAHGVERAAELAEEHGGGDVVIHGLDGQPRDTRHVAAS